MRFLPIALAALTLAPAAARADAPATLSQTTHVGWFAGSTVDATTIDGRVPLAGGLRGGWLVDDAFGVGVAVNGFATKLGGGDRREAWGAYGGLLLRYAIEGRKVVHPYVEATFGHGYACAGDAGAPQDCMHAQQFYVFEPTASVEINLASFARLAVGAGYRVAVTDADRALSNRDLRGMVVRAGLELGQF